MIRKAKAPVRQKGSKNLKKIGKNKVENQNGVQFTLEEKRKLNNEVSKANRKRTKMLHDEKLLPVFIGGTKRDITVGQAFEGMGKESDFILAPKSKSMQRFRSRKEFNKYMHNLKKVNAKEYVDKRVNLYKKNYGKAMMKVFEQSKGGKLAKGSKQVRKALKAMSTSDYMKGAQSNERMEIWYPYKPDEAMGLLNRIRGSFGLENID